MKQFALGKSHKLCSRSAVERLFVVNGSHSDIAYPLRALWREAGRPADEPTRFLITVPKKRLHKAVDRVLMRRRIREAYRLLHASAESGAPRDLAFIYVANEPRPYRSVEKAMRKLLGQIYKPTNDTDAGTATDERAD